MIVDRYGVSVVKMNSVLEMNGVDGFTEDAYTNVTNYTIKNGQDAKLYVIYT